MTDPASDALTVHALDLASKGVERDDGYTYWVTAADIVDYSKTIRELVAERDDLRAQLDTVRRYAEDRAATGRAGRTVTSLRIASDLFAILDVKHNWDVARLGGPWVGREQAVARVPVDPKMLGEGSK